VRPMVLGDKFDSTMNYRFATALLSFLRDTPFSDGDGNLGLTPDEEAAIVAFMKTLSDGYPSK